MGAVDNRRRLHPSALRCTRYAIDRPRAHRGLQVEHVVHDGGVGGTRRDAEGNGDARRPVVTLRLAEQLELKILYRHGVAGDGLRCA